ncbi:MAG: hypothetical protein ACWA6X_07570 [Bauldia sp.]
MNGPERLQYIRDYWNELEARVKEVEQIRQEPLVAAINEMRYAGRRIVDVLHLLAANGGVYDKAVEDELVVAHTYLVNADHDATDGVCFYAHKRIRRVIEVHGVAKLQKHVPEFESLYPEILKAQETIRVSRKDRPSRSEEYDKLAKSYVPRLMALNERMRAVLALRVEDDVPKRINILQRNVVIVGWLALAGSAASIISLIHTW